MMKHIIIFFVAGLAVAFSILLPVTVETRKNLSHVEFGLPIPFAWQDLSLLSPPRFPVEVGGNWSPLEWFRPGWSPGRFIADLLIVYLLFEILSVAFAKGYQVLRD